jgi:hypothetical protein
LDVGVHYMRLLRRLFGEAEACARLPSPACATDMRSEMPAPAPGRAASAVGLDASVGTTAGLAGLGGDGAGCSSLECEIRFGVVTGRVRLDFGCSRAVAESSQPKVLTVIGEHGSLVYDIAAATVVCTRTGPMPAGISDGCGERMKDGWIDGGVYASLLDAFTQIYRLRGGFTPAGRVGRAHRLSAQEGLADLMLLRAAVRCMRAPNPVAVERRIVPVRAWSMVDASRTWRFTPRCVVHCGSVADVLDAVTLATANRWTARARGTGHAWSSYGGTDGVCLDVRPMDRLVAIDDSQPCRWVTVQAGMLIATLVNVLAAHSLCLGSVPMLLDQTIGGAVTTGSHGSSWQYGSLTDQMIGVRLVHASAEPPHSAATVWADVAEHSDVLEATRAAPGRTGIVCEVRLRVEPAYYVTRRIDEFALDEITERCATAMHPPTWHAWAKWRVGHDRAAMCVLERVPALTLGAQSYDGTNWHPFEAPAGTAVLAGPHKHAPLHSVVVSMQYRIGLHRLPEAVHALHAIDEYHGREIEVKFVRRSAADGLCGASSDCDSTCVCVNIWWELPGAIVVETIAPFESTMLKLGGTAHPGKLHDQSKVAGPSSPRTLAVIGLHDPLQTFAPVPVGAHWQSA